MSYVHCTRRRRKGKHLDYAERQELEWLVRENHEAAKSKRKTQKQLAQLLDVSEATLSRELKRGRVVLRDSDWREYVSYSADVAQADYDRKATLKGPGKSTLFRTFLKRHQLKIALGTGSTILTG